MANILYANNAAGTLAAGITNASTTLTLQPGVAALFPNPSAPQVFYATLTDAATQSLIEIVKVTAVSGNVFSIVRAQDGTSALSWNANDIVSQRTIRLELQGFENAAEGNFAALGVAISPVTTLGILGTTFNDNANAGSVGELKEAGTSVPFAITSAVTTNIVALSLTAGDWDVTGIFQTQPAGSTVTNNAGAGISAISGAFAGTPVGGVSNIQSFGPNSNVGQSISISAPITRIVIGSTVTVYLVANITFTSGAMNAVGYMRARRIR